MSVALDAFTAAAVIAGAFLFLAGTAGLLRFPDAMSRLHALTKADNLGLGLIVLGLLPRADGPVGAAKLVAIWLLAQLIATAVTQILGRAIRSGAGDTA